MMSLGDAIALGSIISELRRRESEEPERICCRCKNLQTKVQPLTPEEGTIIHYCKLSGNEVEWAHSCMTGKFERK